MKWLNQLALTMQVDISSLLCNGDGPCEPYLGNKRTAWLCTETGQFFLECFILNTRVPDLSFCWRDNVNTAFVPEYLSATLLDTRMRILILFFKKHYFIIANLLQSFIPSIFFNSKWEWNDFDFVGLYLSYINFVLILVQ